MPSITIQGTLIDFPDSAQSPNWSEPIIQFAQAVEQALSTVAGPFDVPPQIYVMVSNTNTDQSLPSLAFPTSTVRGAFIRYTVFRNTTSTGASTVAEAGNIVVVYNPNAVGAKWEITRDYVGNAQVTFSMTDDGQIKFSSTPITGSSHTGQITYTAQALLNS